MEAAEIKSIDSLLEDLFKHHQKLSSLLEKPNNQFRSPRKLSGTQEKHSAAEAEEKEDRKSKRSNNL